MKKSIIILIALTAFIIHNVYAINGSINNPSIVLDVDISDGKEKLIQSSIIIKNTNDYPVKINLKTDGYYSSMISFADNNFILEPYESKEARFDIKIKSGGNYEGNIYIGFTDLKSSSDSLQLNSLVIIYAKGPINQYYHNVINKVTKKDADEIQLDNNPVAEDDNIGDIITADKVPNSEENRSSTNLITGTFVIIVVVSIGLISFFTLRKVLDE